MVRLKSFVKRESTAIEFGFEGVESAGLDEGCRDDLVGFSLDVSSHDRDGVITDELHRGDFGCASEFVPLRVRVTHLEDRRHFA